MLQECIYSPTLTVMIILKSFSNSFITIPNGIQSLLWPIGAFSNSLDLVSPLRLQLLDLSFDLITGDTEIHLRLNSRGIPWNTNVSCFRSRVTWFSSTCSQARKWSPSAYPIHGLDEVVLESCCRAVLRSDSWPQSTILPPACASPDAHSPCT